MIDSTQPSLVAGIAKLPDEILAAVFEEIFLQFEIARNHSDLPRPIPQAVVSEWADMPKSWMSQWRCDVFTYNLNTVIDGSWNARRAFLMAVASVSRRWREVALHTPRLWRYITLDEDEQEACSFFPPQLCLKRSGVVPLHIYAFDSGSLEHMLDHLAAGSHLDRIERLDIVPPPPWTKKILEHLGSMTYSQLRHLTLSISFDLSSMQALLDFLSKCSMLHSLNLQYLFYDFNTPAPKRSISLENLRNLEIAFCYKADLMKLFPMFRGHRLERLLLARYQDSYDMPGPLLRSDFEGFQSVRELVVGGAMSTADISSLLLHTPKVAILRCFQPLYPTTVIDLLSSLDSVGQLAETLSNLRNLTFGHMYRADSRTGRTLDLSPFLDTLHHLIDGKHSNEATRIRSIGLSNDILSHAPPSSLKSLALKVDLTEWRPPHWHDSLWD